MFFAKALIKNTMDEQKKTEIDNQSEEMIPDNTAADISSATEHDVIADLQKQLDDRKDLYMRALASLDNFKKRAQKEREEIKTLAICSIVEDLLPVLDHFELGLQAASQSNASDIISGFQMVLDQFKDVLSTYGLSVIDPMNQEFNPHEHDCIRREFSEKNPENMIVFVMRKGYKIWGRLVRPAAVVVSTKQAIEENE